MVDVMYTQRNEVSGMDRKYYVIEEKACPTCHGDGYLQNPLWKEFFEEERRRGNLTPEEFFDELGYGEPPEEEYVCPACNGEGGIIRRVSLKAALFMLGYKPAGKEEK